MWQLIIVDSGDGVTCSHVCGCMGVLWVNDIIIWDIIGEEYYGWGILWARDIMGEGYYGWGILGVRDIMGEGYYG